MEKELAEVIEENGIVYHLAKNGCYYPDVRLPEGTHYNIGKYGLMRWEYLLTNRRREYIRLLLDGKLNEYLHEVDEECHARVELLVEQMKAGTGITEELKAANQILTDEVADLILLGKPAEINELAVKWGLGNISKATIIDPETSPKHEEYAQLLCELRKKKGMTIEEARQLTNDPLFYGCLMIKSGDADGQLAGARNTTGNVLRPALQIIKTAPGITCVSGAMLLLTHAPEYGKNGILVMGDVAVTPVPDPNQLAQIAVCTAQTAKAVAGIENPKVAMLSFSTKGSAKHEVVDKVVEATKIAKEMAPTLDLDGEMQADAALVPEVGASKAPGSPVAGEANVLIVPSLEVGNISYKLVQRLGHADAIGPILQGIARPVNDLSRGCSIEDVYRMIAITANQAIAAKNNK